MTLSEETTKEDIDFIVKCFIEVSEEMGLNK